MCNMDSVVIPRPPAPPTGLFGCGLQPQPKMTVAAMPSAGGAPNKRKSPPMALPPPPPPLPPAMLNNGRLNPHQQQPNGNGNGHALTVGSDSVRSRRSSTSGFRLMENQDDTGSIYSIYKQKIDSMFESDASSVTKNSVQARIEKMFSDVAIDNGIAVVNEIGCHAFSVDYLGSVPLQEKVTSLTGLQKPLRDLYFAYRRSKAVTNGNNGNGGSSVSSSTSPGVSVSKKTLTGKLEISAAGLKVQYQGEKGDLEQLNSFPTIAVWSAVKFVVQPLGTGTVGAPAYAFLPLITDPDNIDKQQLFRALSDAERQYIAVGTAGTAGTNETHSPLFAVVMRKIGVHKQLECHGFVCQTSEDAIVIAATLYKSLMTHMKAKEKRPRNRNGVTCMSVASSNVNDSAVASASAHLVPVRPPRKKRSTTSSTNSDGEPIDADTAPLLPNSSSSLANKKKSNKSKRAPKSPEDPCDLDAILPYEEPISPDGTEPLLSEPDITPEFSPERDRAPPHQDSPPEEELEIAEIKPQKLSDKWNTYMSQNQKQIAAEIKQVMSESTNMGLKRVKSLRKRADEIKVSENTGDILTKVTIPRSGSFLNAGGLTRYKSKVHRLNGQATGGSPLGFNELFNEFRLQEGLHSMDEILGVIIDSEGMSFNDLKPIYKEFLLKLAVTLTKDELYQRSKSIMRRQKKKLIRRSSSAASKRKHTVVCSKFNKRLKHVFQKLKIAKPVPEESNCLPSNEELTDKLPESSISTSSYDTRQFRPKEATPTAITRKQSYRKRASDNGSRQRRERASTSEESDFFSLRRSKSKSQSLLQSQNRNSSSGYVSYSECSYDSDTCTCISADKCYCSLGTNRTRSNRVSNHRSCKSSSKTCRHEEEKCYCTGKSSTGGSQLTLDCGCDTDSCTDSNKCYCSAKKHHQKQASTIFEQLKQRGFIPSSGSVTTPPNSRKLKKKHSNTKSTKSLEYMHNPTEKYYEKLKPKLKVGSVSGKIRTDSADNLALDYELFTVERERGGYGNRLIYGRSLSESGASHHLLVEDKNMSRLYHSTRNRSNPMVDSAYEGGHCHDPLSVKKSAEIAALFTDIKLSQTTDVARPVGLGPHLYAQALPHHQRSGSVSSYNRLAVSSRPTVPNRMIVNSLYTVRNVPHHYRPGSAHGAHQQHHHRMHYSSEGCQANNMYSTKNGLYTIQSQSDDSRSSSGAKQQHRRKDFSDAYNKCKLPVQVGSNLENSLGYLP